MGENMIVRIGARLIPFKTTNRITITFTNISWDCNSYTKRTMDIDDADSIPNEELYKKIHQIISIYSIPWIMDSNDIYKEDLVLKKVIEKGNELNYDGNSIDLYEDMVGLDMTIERTLNTPHEITFKYIDRVGHDYMIEIVVGEKVFMCGINKENIREVLNEF